MTKIEIRGMSFFRGDDGRNSYQTLALAEVYLPELDMTVRDVRLTWSARKGYVAQTPSVRAVHPPILQWFHGSRFAKDLTARLVDMFSRMGGNLPAPAPAIRVDHVTGKRIGPDPFEMAKAGEIEHRTFPATWTVDEAEPVAEADDHEATEGLHRVLGVGAVEETMAKAGL